jgi:hypothetical protein
METPMENISAPQVQPAVATPQPQAMPMATPSPTPQAIPQATPQMADGGTTDSGSGDNSVKSFFNSFNLMETILLVMGVASLSYVIYYYRFKVQQDKLINNELQRQIDEIKMNLQSNLKGKYKAI